VEDGRGEGGQVVLTGTKLFRFPGVGESLGVKLGVTEHFLQACVIEGAVGGRIQSVLWDPNLMPRGCPYIGVLPSTLTLRDSYSRLRRLMTHSES